MTATSDVTRDNVLSREADLRLLLTPAIRCSRGTLIWSNSDKTTGLSEFSIAEAFLALCVHVGGSWGD